MKQAEISHSSTTPLVTDSSGLAAWLSLIGWSDLSLTILEVESTDRDREDRLKQAWQSYTLQPDTQRGWALMDRLREAQTVLAREQAYAEKQHTLYQAQAKQEAKQNANGLIADWTQWFWRGVQNFFGSSSAALAEKYAQAAADCQMKQAKLSAYAAALQQILLTEDDKESETEAVMVIDTDTVKATQRRLLQQSGALVSVQNPIPDQWINLNQPYVYSLNDVFSAGYVLLGEIGAGSSNLPSGVNLHYQFSGRYDTADRAIDLVVSGDTALVADYANGLVILNVSMPTAPSLLSSYDTTGFAQGVAAAGNLAFIADFSGGLVILNISTPSAPQLVSLYSVTGVAVDVTVSGDTVFVATDTNGLVILDVSAPSLPQWVSTYDTAGAVRGVTLSGNFALVADGLNGLVILDISTLNAPQFVGGYDTPGFARSVAVRGNTVFVADSDAGLVILDITTASAPQFRGLYNTPGVTVGVVALSDHIVGVADESNGVWILDVSMASTPQLLGGYEAVNFVYQIVIVGSTLYGADWNNGLLILDLSQGQLAGTPQGVIGQQHSVTLGAYNTTAALASTGFTLTLDQLPYPALTALSDQSLFPGDILSLTLNSELLFVNSANSFLALSLQGENNATLPDWWDIIAVPIQTSHYDIGDEAVNLVVSDNTVLLVDRFNGLFLFDISLPDTPQLLSRYNTTGLTLDVAVSNQIAFIANDGEGVWILNVSTPASPQFLSRYDTPGHAKALAVVNNTLVFVADHENGLVILDISMPSAPQLLGGYNTLGFAGDVAVSNDRAFIACGVDGLVILNVSTPSAPQWLTRYNGTESVWSITIVGDTLFVADYFEGLFLLNISIPGAPQFVSRYKTPGVVNNVVVLGGTAFLADSSNGLVILDVTQPDTPRLLGGYDTAGLARGVAVAGNLALIADGGNGLVLLDMRYWQLTAYPTLTDVGNYHVRLIATDSVGGAAVDSFMTRVEGPPQVHDRIRLQYAVVSQIFDYFVPQGLFTDPNFDSISFTALLSDGRPLPSWLRFNSVSAALTGIPLEIHRSTLNLTIEATDYIAGSTQVTFLLFVGSSIAQPSVLRAGRAFTFTVPNATFAVEDGRSRRYEATQNSGELLPDWLTFNAQILQFQGMPPLGVITAATSLALTIMATDDQNDTMIASLSFPLAPNFPLQVNPISVQTATVGNAFVFFVPTQTFINNNGYPLVYSAAPPGGGELPAWLHFNQEQNQTPVFSGTPGHGDTDFYALRPVEIQLDAFDGVVSARTLFTIQVGGVSYGQLAATIGAPLISVLTALYSLYQLRALCLNRCRKQHYQREVRESAVGEELTLRLQTPAEQIHQVMLKLPPTRSRCSCFQFFKLPSALPGGASLPPWLEYEPFENVLRTKTPIPRSAPKDLIVQVCGERGVILEQFELRILPTRSAPFAASSQVNRLVEEEPLLSPATTSSASELDEIKSRPAPDIELQILSSSASPVSTGSSSERTAQPTALRLAADSPLVKAATKSPSPRSDVSGVANNSMG
jgi:hypothetical protein